MSTVWRVQSARTQKYRDFYTRREAVAEAFNQIDEHYINGEESRELSITLRRTFDSGDPCIRIYVDGLHFINAFRTEEDYGKGPSK
jgi:hypothetical protein